jgi:hypothetical protein
MNLFFEAVLVLLLLTGCGAARPDPFANEREKFPLFVCGDGSASRHCNINRQ